MRSSTLCFVALACLMAQFTNALPMNLKRTNDAAAGNFGNGIHSGSGAIVANEGAGNSAKVLTGAAATPDGAEAIAAADGGAGGKEVAKTISKNLDVGVAKFSGAAGLAGAIDPNNKGAAAAGALAGGTEVAGLVGVTGAVSGAESIGTGGKGKNASIAGSVTVPIVGKLEGSDAGSLAALTNAEDRLGGVGHGSLPGL